MIKSAKNIMSAKEIISALSGKTVSVKVNLGRNRKTTFTGVLSGVYPALFTVSPFDKDYTGKTSYSYSEYLCGDVVVKEKIEKN